MANDLLFRALPLGGPPTTLVFGEPDEPSSGGAVLSGALALPVFLVAGTTTATRPPTAVAGGALYLSVLAFSGTAVYDSATQRPLVGERNIKWQRGTEDQARTESRWGSGERRSAAVAAEHQSARPLSQPLDATWAASLRLVDATVSRHQDAISVRAAAVLMQWEESRRLRNGARTGWQEGTRLPPMGASVRYQSALSLRTARHVRWQVAARQDFRHEERAQAGAPMSQGGVVRWQEAMRPPAGRHDIVVPPVDPCYIPSTELVFEMAPATDNHLVFLCERHTTEPPDGTTVVVPVKRVYMVLNNASLRRVDGNIHIPTFRMSMSLDTDTFTWGFDAEVPVAEESNLEPSSDGDPVEVEINVNGVAYRVMVETMERTREFARSSTRISGRGKSALLDAPYAPVMSFGNINARTAQQLMADALTFNGVGIGWDVEWGLTDWLVPAGVFSHQGSYISALDAIAKAAGGFLQPTNTAQTLRVLPRYATLPRDWGDVVPDFELPVDVTTREGIEWVEKPRYNRVYVSGTAGGRLGIATLAGTAGDLIAPQVVDSLLTHVDAERQRAVQVFGDTGRQAALSLRLPVLEETGIITPGKFIRYVDGGVTRLGVVRKVGVDIGTPEIWQTIGVETHVIPA